MSTPPTVEIARPGVLPWTLGDRVVVPLNDGYLAVTPDVVAGLAADEVARLQAEGFRDAVAPRISVNAFLILGARAPILVDSGMGGKGPASLGHLPAALAACGVAPEAIGTVLLTHLHADHYGGLVGPDGLAAFPSAELVLSEAEAVYWLDGDAANSRADVERRRLAARAAVQPYRGRVRRVAAGEVVPGIEAVPAPGHTPGHTAYRLHAGGASLLIWGDVVHFPAIQFSHPDVGVAFDVDGDVARATRTRILDEAACERSLVAGMHLDFPALGYVRRAGAAFAWVPEQWSAVS